MRSVLQARGSVSFPHHAGPERIYMVPFRKAQGLPAAYRHWQGTVTGMLAGIETDGDIYLMVDRAFVRAGTPHRRPGLHIDGYWQPAMNCHGAGEGKHRPTRRHDWEDSPFDEPEAVLLASSVSAAQGFVGNFSGTIGDRGDCSEVDTQEMERVSLDAGRVYAGNVTFLHESLPVTQDTWRTVVRLNVPGWSPYPTDQETP